MTKIRYGANKKKRVARVMREIRTRISRRHDTAEDHAVLAAIKAGTY